MAYIKKTELEIELNKKGLGLNFKKKDPMIKTEQKIKKINWNKFPF